MYFPYGFGYGLGNSGLFLLLILVLVLGMAAQAALRRTFNKYSQILARSRISAADMARNMLRDAGSAVAVTEVRGSLTDHFDPKSNTVRLSEDVYPSASIAALAVAAHEIGHVIQYEEEYIPIRIRNAILPVANLGSQAAPFIVLIGALFGMFNLAMVGVYLFLGVLAFQLVTLPVEFNASRRAVRMLTEGGYLEDAGEAGDAKKVLNMAAMTYVVAALATVVTLLRLVMIAQSGRRR
jgi:Zn-dependent membrane protease YugP